MGADQYQLLEKLGEGTFGRVFKAFDKKAKKPVAVKVVLAEADCGDVSREIEMLKACSSDNIVQYYASFAHKSELWIVMEYCAGSSLGDIMEARSRCLTEPQISAVIGETLSGLEYLHNLGTIHRDIKAGNLLLTDRGRVKLADFGVSAQLSATIARRGTVIGTPFWMAPEVIASTPPPGTSAEKGYHTKADIWSLGITAIELAEGQPPHASLPWQRAIFLIPTANAPTVSEPDKWSAEFNEFTTQCLTKDPNKRLDAKTLSRVDFVLNGKDQATEVLKRLYDTAAEPLAKFRTTRVNGLASKGGTIRTGELNVDAIRSMAEQERRVEAERVQNGTQEFDISAIREMARMLSPSGQGVGASGTTVIRNSANGVGTVRVHDIPIGGDGSSTIVMREGGGVANPGSSPTFMRKLFGGESVDSSANASTAPISAEEINGRGRQRSDSPPIRVRPSSSKYNFSHLSLQEIDEELECLPANLERDLAKLRRQYEKRGKALRMARDTKLELRKQDNFMK